jgi:hypothetical protein
MADIVGRGGKACYLLGFACVDGGICGLSVLFVPSDAAVLALVESKFRELLKNLVSSGDKAADETLKSRTGPLRWTMRALLSS